MGDDLDTEYIVAKHLANPLDESILMIFGYKEELLNYIFKRKVKRNRKVISTPEDARASLDCSELLFRILGGDPDSFLGRS